MKSLSQHVNEAFNTKDATEEVRDYFDMMGVELTSKFDINKMAKYHHMTAEELSFWLANMEDEDVMTDIANGDYDSFDEDERDQFNDGYKDIKSEIKRLRKNFKK